MAEKNPEAYEPDLAMSCNNLGVLYTIQEANDEAEKYLKQACDIYMSLAKAFPDIYEEELLKTLVVLVYAARLAEKIEETKGYCLDALEVINKIKQRGGNAEESKQNIKRLLDMLNDED